MELLKVFSYMVPRIKTNNKPTAAWRIRHNGSSVVDRSLANRVLQLTIIKSSVLWKKVLKYDKQIIF